MSFSTLCIHFLHFFTDCTVAKFNNIHEYISQVSEETLRKAHRDETRLAALNASIDKENERIMLDNLINKNTQRYEKHVKLSHAAAVIELDPDKFIPNDAKGISKVYAKFKKAAKDAHLDFYGIMNVEK